MSSNKVSKSGASHPLRFMGESPCYSLNQWSPTLGLQMFLDFNSQKSWPAQLMVKVSGSCSLRTSGGTRLRTTALEEQDKPNSTSGEIDSPTFLSKHLG